MSVKAKVRKTFGKMGQFSSKQRKDMQSMVDDLYDIFSGDSDSVTATTGGGTTGLISADAQFVTVTSDSANKQISLPAANIGKQIKIFVGANGCEMISAVAAHKVNNVVVGATNEAAIPANTFLVCDYVAANTWLVVGYNNLGAEITTIVPDAL